MSRQLRTNTPAILIVASVSLLIVVIPLGILYWVYRDYLVYLGMFFLAVILLAVLAVVFALIGWCISKFHRPIEAIPATRDGSYVVRGSRIIPLAPMEPVLQLTAPTRAINHVPVGINYVIDEEPPYTEEEIHMVDTSVLEEEVPEEEVPIVPNSQELLLGLAREAYKQGSKSRAKMAEVLGVSERKAGELIKKVKER